MKHTPWTKVFGHNTRGGLFTSKADALSKNPDTPDGDLFSVLDQLDNFRLEDGSFHLKICYPEHGECNEWTQSSNPVTESSILNFKAIHMGMQEGGKFVGLGAHPAGTQAILGDTPGGSWWFAIGARQYHDGPDTIPGPNHKSVKIVELFAETPGRTNI